MQASETSVTNEATTAACCVAGSKLSLLRQAQLVAGTLALAGFVLGTFVAPAFHLLSGIVGLGLLHAGLSGRCGMASLLGRLPFNRGTPAV